VSRIDVCLEDVHRARLALAAAKSTRTHVDSLRVLNADLALCEQARRLVVVLELRLADARRRLEEARLEAVALEAA